MPIIETEQQTNQNVISGQEYLDAGATRELAGQLQGYAIGYDEGYNAGAASAGGSSGADIESNKSATIDVSAYTEPVEITPTQGKDGMAKATVTLSNIPSGVTKLYCWYSEIGVGDTHYFYTVTVEGEGEGACIYGDSNVDISSGDLPEDAVRHSSGDINLFPN